jgi:hypothetical protein
MSQENAEVINEVDPVETSEVCSGSVCCKRPCETEEEQPCKEQCVEPSEEKEQPSQPVDCDALYQDAVDSLETIKEMISTETVAEEATEAAAGCL